MDQWLWCATTELWLPWRWHAVDILAGKAHLNNRNCWFLQKGSEVWGLRLSELTSNTYLPQKGKATPLTTFQRGKIQPWLGAWPKQLPSLDHWFYSSPRPWLWKIITIWEAGKLPLENELGGPRLVSHGQVSAPQNHSHNCCQLLVGFRREAQLCLGSGNTSGGSRGGISGPERWGCLCLFRCLLTPPISWAVGDHVWCCPSLLWKMLSLTFTQRPSPGPASILLKGCSKKFQRALCVEGVQTTHVGFNIFGTAWKILHRTGRPSGSLIPTSRCCRLSLCIIL